MRRLALALCSLLLASPAAAQVIRRGSFGEAPASAWVSLGAGLSQAWTVTDGTTGSTWEFGSATQFTASLEKAFSAATVGIRGTTSLVPLRYTGTTSAGAGAVDADANVSQLLASVHVGSGRGFHTVLELDAGATYYSGFREHTGGAALAPASDADFTFVFGYGAGYGFSNRFAVDVVQDYATSWHQRAGLPSNADASASLHSTRIVGRFGLGRRQ